MGCCRNVDRDHVHHNTSRMTRMCSVRRLSRYGCGWVSQTCFFSRFDYMLQVTINEWRHETKEEAKKEKTHGQQLRRQCGKQRTCVRAGVSEFRAQFSWPTYEYMTYMKAKTNQPAQTLLYESTKGWKRSKAHVVRDGSSFGTHLGNVFGNFLCPFASGNFCRSGVR